MTFEKTDNAQGTVKAETNIGRRLWLESLRYALTTPINVLHKHRWTIVKSPPGITWPTSDNPVIRLAYKSHTDYHLQSGWGLENGNILLPLSTTHLMFTQIGQHRPWPRGTTLDTPTAHFFRRLIVENADRFIFSSPPENDIAQMRPRTVCSETSKKEKEMWDNWHQEQSQAERRILTP